MQKLLCDTAIKVCRASLQRWKFDHFIQSSHMQRQQPEGIVLCNRSTGRDEDRTRISMSFTYRQMQGSLAIAARKRGIVSRRGLCDIGSIVNQKSDCI